VYAKLFLTGEGGGPLATIPVPGQDASLVGFVDRDQELIVRSGGTLFRYTIAGRTLSTIATGVTALATPPIDASACS
jgi:hypothetical protein